MRVVPFSGGGRDLALQHETWKVVIYYILLTSHNGDATPYDVGVSMGRTEKKVDEGGWMRKEK